MIDIYLIETLYRAFNSGMKPIVDNVAGGSFFDLTFLEALEMLDRMTKRSRAWHTRDSVVARPITSVGITMEQRKREKAHDQDMAHLKM